MAKKKYYISLVVAIVSGMSLMNFAGMISSGDTSALPMFVLSFAVFGVSAPYSVYAYNYMKNMSEKGK